MLPTGDTPLPMYEELRRRAAAGRLRTERATLFELDEYCGLTADDPRSYRRYLRDQLAGIRFASRHGLAGDARDLDAECARYQRLLDEAPIDLVLLGLGRDGHVAFDEPGSLLDEGVRVVGLQPTTRQDAAPDFGGVDRVPTEALTVGLRTIRSAGELLVLVTGVAKAPALHAMLDGPVGPQCPASLLRDHPRLTLLCDREAASRLTASELPEP